MALRKEIILAFFEDPVFCRDLACAVTPGTVILTASTAQQALELISSGSSSLLILTHSLLNSGGFDFLRSVRSFNPDLPIIPLLDHTKKGEVLDLVHFGVFDILEKPVTRAAIRSVLDRIDPLLVAQPEPDDGNDETGGRFPLKNRLVFWMPWLRKRPGADIKEIASNSSSLRHSGSGLVSQPVSEEPVAAGTSLHVHLLGHLQVSLGGRQVTQWPGHKAKLLFTYLCSHHTRRVSRDLLMEKFWPCSSADSARNSLNVAIHSLRRWFGESLGKSEVICYEDECYYFHPGLKIFLDTEEFNRLWRQGQMIEREKGYAEALPAYEAAAELYHGDFLEEYPYEAWTELDRDNLREIYLLILDRISNHYALDGKPEVAITLCEQILVKDNCREDVYRRMMKCYERIGQRDRAVKIYRKCSQILREELGVEPCRETREFYEKMCSSQRKISNI